MTNAGAETALPNPIGAEALDAWVRLARLRRRMFERVEQPTIGEFDVLRKLGEGGMGVVFAGWDRALDRLVAIKLLRGSTTAGDADVLQREAIALARLRHPNVVTIYAVGRHHEQLFLAMEYIDGETLRAWVARWRTGTRDLSALLEIFLQAARGLAAAHAAGLVHRDVKPENAMIGADGRLQLMDFGLARPHAGGPAPSSDPDRPRRADSLPAWSETTGFAGTHGYVAPEVLAGERPSPAADQYALAVCLYEALFGRRPTDPESGGASPKHDRLPRSIGRLLERGLASDPAERWRSMDAFAAAIERAARRGRGRRATVAALVAALGLGGTLAWLARPAPCEDAEAQLGVVWGASRRTAVSTNLSRGDAPQAVETILSRLDRTRDAWIAQHREACLATRVAGSQPESTLERRMWCLDRRRAELDALTARLQDVEPSATTLEEIVRLVDRLEPLDACGDLDYLQSELPIPADAAMRDTVAEARVELDRLRATGALGDDVDDALERLRSRARDIGFRPFEAEVAFATAIARNRRFANASETEALLLDALDIAEEVGHRRLAASVWMYLVFQAGSVRGDPEDFAFYRRRAAAALRRAGDPVHLRWELEHYLGTGALRLHEYDTALAHFEEAMRLYPGERESLDFANASANYSNLLLRMGRLDAAEERNAEAARIGRALLGDDHPAVAAYELNEVEIAKARGDMAAAEHQIEHVLAKLDRIGEAGMTRAIALNERATMRYSRREFEAAVEDARAAEALFEGSVGPDASETRAIRPLLASALRASGRCDEAIEILDKWLSAPNTDTFPPFVVSARLDRARCRLDRDPAGSLEDLDAAQAVLDTWAGPGTKPASEQAERLAKPLREQVEHLRERATGQLDGAIPR